MAKLIGDIMAPRGKYTDKDGEERTRWAKMGVLLQSEKGYRVNLFAVPLGGGDEDGLWFSVFEPRDKAGPAKKADEDPTPF